MVHTGRAGQKKAGSAGLEVGLCRGGGQDGLIHRSRYNMWGRVKALHCNKDYP